MSLGKVAIDQDPGNYVSGARARWLIQARRARLTSAGTLLLLHGPAHAVAGAGGSPSVGEDAGPERAVWTAYSSAGATNRCHIRWLGGFHMNGDAVNHG